MASKPFITVDLFLNNINGIITPRILVSTATVRAV